MRHADRIEPAWLDPSSNTTVWVDLAGATDEVHRLAYAIPALCIQLLISQDVINAITPHMLSTPEAISAWCGRLVDYAEALFNAEKLKLQRKA